MCYATCLLLGTCQEPGWGSRLAGGGSPQSSLAGRLRGLLVPGAGASRAQSRKHLRLCRSSQTCACFHECVICVWVCVELPQERVDEMFMIAMPSRPTQQQQQATQQKQQIQQQQGSQQQQKQRHESGNKRPSSAAAAAARGLPAASPAGILQALSGAAGSSQPRSQAQPQPLASSEAATAEQPGESDQRAAKRARRAQERAYNESVIAGAANPDEQLARQLQEAEQQAAAAAADGGGRGRGRGQGRQGRGKKMGVKDRLAQKLLRGAVVAAAGAESARAEGEARRDKFGVHQW